jgi:uncharacterized protein (TIGR02001 family)
MSNTIQRLALLALAATTSTPRPRAAGRGRAPLPSSLTANAGLFSNYRFRGLDQTFGKPAVQGGFDYTRIRAVRLELELQ